MGDCQLASASRELLLSGPCLLSRLISVVCMAAHGPDCVTATFLLALSSSTRVCLRALHLLHLANRLLTSLTM